MSLLQRVVGCCDRHVNGASWLAKVVDPLYVIVSALSGSPFTLAFGYALYRPGEA